MIKCFIFDFGQVLGIFDIPKRYKFIEKYRGNCLDPRDLSYESLRTLGKRFDLGEIDKTTYYSQIRLAYKMSIPTERDFYEMFTKGILSIDREMLGIINWLRQRGVITVLISNMNLVHFEFISEVYPEVFESFDHMMISCKEGIIKPDLRAWTIPVHSLGFKMNECVFVDDLITNIEAACQLGIIGWYYNVSDEHLCMNGKLEQERVKLKNFLILLNNLGLLFDKTKSH